MKKIIFVFFIFISTLFGYENLDYAQAIQKAKETNRHLVLVLKSQYCPWCTKLINNVLENPDVKTMIEQNFVLVILDREQDKYPDKFYSRLVPTTFFIDSKKEDEVDMIIGYVRYGEFLNKLKEVLNSKDIKETK